MHQNKTRALRWPRRIAATPAHALDAAKRTAAFGLHDR